MEYLAQAHRPHAVHEQPKEGLTHHHRRNAMKQLLLIAVLLITITACGSSSEIPPPLIANTTNKERIIAILQKTAARSKVPYQVIDFTYYPAFAPGEIDISTANLLRITSQDALEKFWSSYQSNTLPTAPPPVDFDQKTVFVIVCPNLPLGGYSCSVDNIYKKNNEIIIVMTYTSLSEGCSGVALPSQPTMVITLDRVEEPAVLHMYHKSRHCWW